MFRPLFSQNLNHLHLHPSKAVLLLRSLRQLQPSNYSLNFLALYRYKSHSVFSYSNTRIKRSAVGRTFVLLVGISLSAAFVHLYQQSKHSVYDSAPAESEDPQTPERFYVMVSAPPGRPGNLTSEQEAKLQEFWKAALRVFGVTAEGRVEVRESIDGSVQGTEQDDPTTGKKKKKRLGLFGKKKADGKELDVINGASANPSDTEDKYGQAKDFQRVLASQTPEDLRKTFWSMVKHDHPDGLLLRFLRARKWDVEKALIMLISTMHWRSQEMHVDDDIMKNGEGAAAADTSSPNAAVKKEAEDFMRQLRLGKSFLHGCDKEGRPICLVRARLHHQGEQSEASLEKVTVHLIETARLLLSPPVDTAVCILLFIRKGC